MQNPDTKVLLFKRAPVTAAEDWEQFAEDFAAVLGDGRFVLRTRAQFPAGKTAIRHMGVMHYVAGVTRNGSYMTVSTTLTDGAKTC